MNIKTLAISGALVALLGACAQQEEPGDDIVAVFAKDGSVIGYQRTSDGASVDIDGNPVAGFGEGNPRGFGSGASGDPSADGSTDTDDDED